MKARAKVNLNLMVIDKRKDNYHNIKSIFQKVNLYDELLVTKNKGFSGLKFETNIEELNSEDNIICKAYKKMKDKYKQITGVTVKLNKKIPMQAGMAGGSTDCASFILCMDRLFNLKLTKSEIEDLGKSLGADVVPCLYNNALLVEGIGDKTTPINTKFKYYFIIIKPEINCSTKEMYKKIDAEYKIKQIDKTEDIIKALENENIGLLKNSLYNVFEDVIESKELINNIKRELINNGAIASLMTGSGSCIYGIFQDKQMAKTVYKIMKNRYRTYICTSYNSKRR